MALHDFTSLAECSIITQTVFVCFGDLDRRAMLR